MRHPPFFVRTFCLQLVSFNFLFVKAAFNQIDLVGCSHHTIAEMDMRAF